MTDELDDPFAPTELHGFEGTLLDPNWWEVRRARLEELGRPALWYWEEEWQPYQVSMGPNRKAAPIAEGDFNAGLNFAIVQMLSASPSSPLSFGLVNQSSHLRRGFPTVSL